MRPVIFVRLVFAAGIMGFSTLAALQASARTPSTEKCILSAVEVFPHDPPEDLLPELTLGNGGWANVSWSALGPYRIHRFIASSGDKGYQLAFPRAMEMVNVATRRMGRRWGSEFLDTRDDVVEIYRERSINLRMDKVHAESSVDQNIATFSLTYSQFTQAILSRLTPEMIVSNRSINLPEESTLGIALPRFTDSSGKGIAIELRTFSKAKEAISKDKEAILTPLQQKIMLVEGVSLALSMLEGYPELWDKTIIHTYGDAKSLKMYGGKKDPVTHQYLDGLLDLGFRPVPHRDVPETGILAYGEHWWPMWVTPNRLKKLLTDLKEYAPIYERIQEERKRFPFRQR